MSEVEKVYYGTREIAKILGWNRWRAREWLLRTGAGFFLGRNVVTTAAHLRDRFPEVWERICEDREERLLREMEEADSGNGF